MYLLLQSLIKTKEKNNSRYCLFFFKVLLKHDASEEGLE